jgi:hypothetical protein
MLFFTPIIKDMRMRKEDVIKDPLIVRMAAKDVYRKPR